MIESRCGILCGECPHVKTQGCPGCTNMQKPFWGESCPVKSCCEGKGHAFCGECAQFPCALLNQFSHDPNQGDGGKRIETCREWQARGCKV